MPKNLSPTDRIEPNATPAETLRQGIGTFHEINLLFAALVRAAGYSVFYVRVGTPDFRREILDAAQLPNEVIAVLQPSGYALFNLGFPYLSAGLLDADEEGQPALLATPEGPVFWTLPRSAPHQSRIDRQSRLALAADGSVSGRLNSPITALPPPANAKPKTSPPRSSSHQHRPAKHRHTRRPGPD